MHGVRDLARLDASEESGGELIHLTEVGEVSCMVCLALLIMSVSGVYGCSQILASSGDNVLFGNNEDLSMGMPLYNNPLNGTIWFYQASSSAFPGENGCVFLGWLWQGDWRSLQGGMNDQGLCYDTTSTPRRRMNPHPERDYTSGQGEYFFARMNLACFREPLPMELGLPGSRGLHCCIDPVTVKSGAPNCRMVLRTAG
jgi:hypothetical protein